MKYEFDITNQLGRKGRKKKKNNRSFFYFYKSKIDIFKAESKNLSFNLIIFITKQFVAVI